MSCNNVSFKSYIPVSYYAKNPKNGKYVPVLKPENKRKCNGFVVRNLNKTAKNNQNKDFVNYYKQYDKDYARTPIVRSVYVDKTHSVYLISGRDVDDVDRMAKPIGIAKSDSLNVFGNTKSGETKTAISDFYQNVRDFLRNTCSRVKNANGENLSLRVYFDPIYTKTDKLKGFEFVNARFIKE